MTTVLLVSGSWPPQPCGVGDYSDRLARELEREGVSVIRFGNGDFAKPYSSGIVNEIRNIPCDLVHIQYPTAGYRRSFTPSALALRMHAKPVVVTLHEYASFRWYRRAWFAPFAQRCAARIFTVDEERALFESRFPERKGRDLTVEIGSNIPAAPRAARAPKRVCYFGLIAPDKGIDEFLDVAAASGAAGHGLSFELIGAVAERHRRYADGVLERAALYGVQASLNLAQDDVAGRLARATFAYLPFPDGASAKRGTLAAALVNGVIVVTRHSGITPEWIRTATVGVSSPDEALAALTQLAGDDARRAALDGRIARAASRLRWEAIAGRHAELYEHLLRPRAAEMAGDSMPPPSARVSEPRLAP